MRRAFLFAAIAACWAVVSMASADSPGKRTSSPFPPFITPSDTPTIRPSAVQQSAAAIARNGVLECRVYDS
ncbi:MAG: hypothetical protein WC712_13445, partial [Candidatus Brocadiia bacterium]